MPDAASLGGGLQQRLLALIARSGALLGSPRVEDVLHAILTLSKDLVSADGYAVWRLDPVRTAWHVAAHAGVSSQFASAMISVFQGQPGAPVQARDPIAAENVADMPLLESRREAYAREGIRSMLAVPIVVHEEATASLVFYYRAPHRFAADEIEIARALGNLAGAALRTADLHDQQRHSEQQALFIARAASALAGSLDYQQTLKTVAQLAVPHIADWCAIHMVSRTGTIDFLGVAHVDPARVALAEEFQRKYPPAPDAHTGITNVIRTGRSERLAHLTDEMIVAGVTDPERLAAVRGLAITSYMIVPLRTRHAVVGAITFVSAESGRRYTEADLRFAETVADRAAAAIENAWAYEEVRLANQLKDEFLATLSHELRTPLNAMIGYARMLRAGVLPAERHDVALEAIDRNGATLTQIVEEILDVSRIVAGKLRLNVGSVHLSQLIADAVATVTPAAQAKNIQIEVHVDGVATLHGDYDRLQQVLWNLLTNAIKFTPNGGHVQVAAQPANGMVEIVVSDNGRGIEAAFLPHVFERFRQADVRFTREHGGLGLGLSIARSIVEMHGGTIEAESPGLGEGATFRVRLPLSLTPTRP
jgi:signal transduction histidine kinase